MVRALVIVNIFEHSLILVKWVGNTMDVGEIINRCFLFFDLEMDFARELYLCFEAKHYRIGEDVFQSGDPGDALYILGKGEVKISSVDSKGQSQVVASLIEGDVIGEMAIVTGKSRSGKCTFISNGTLLMLTLDKYKEMKIVSPKLYVAITRNIARIVSVRLADMTEKVSSLIDGLHSVKHSQIDLEAQLAKGKVGLLDFIGLSRKKAVPVVVSDSFGTKGTAPPLQSKPAMVTLNDAGVTSTFKSDPFGLNKINNRPKGEN